MTRSKLARVLDHSVLKPEADEHAILAGADVGRLGDEVAAHVDLRLRRRATHDAGRWTEHLRGAFRQVSVLVEFPQSRQSDRECAREPE